MAHLPLICMQSEPMRQKRRMGTPHHGRQAVLAPGSPRLPVQSRSPFTPFSLPFHSRAGDLRESFSRRAARNWLGYCLRTEKWHSGPKKAPEHSACDFQFVSESEHAGHLGNDPVLPSPPPSFPQGKLKGLTVLLPIEALKALFSFSSHGLFISSLLYNS